MNRIDKAFERLLEENRKALITFITAGHPSLESTEKIVYTLDKAGADIIELGIPYSDPMADGLVIQNSSYRALQAGTTIDSIMDTVKRVRQSSEIPLVYMVYYSCIFKYGMEKFISNCSKAGVDGIIIPDLPLEERTEVIEISDKYGIYIIPLVAPTSSHRIKSVVKDAKGFIYCVSVNGVTGMRNNLSSNLEEYMRDISEATEVPKALGFGISNKEMAEKYKPYCDGIIIGSALVDIIDKSKNIEEREDNVFKFISEIKSVL